MNETPTDQERIGSHDCYRLGTDAEGRVHYIDERAHRALVTVDGTVVDDHDLGAHSVETDDSDVAVYRDWVAAYCGWDAIGAEQFGEQLATVAGEC